MDSPGETAAGQRFPLGRCASRRDRRERHADVPDVRPGAGTRARLREIRGPGARRRVAEGMDAALGPGGLDGRRGALRGARPGTGPRGRLDEIPLAALGRRLRRKRQRKIQSGRSAALCVRTDGPGGRSADSRGQLHRRRIDRPAATDARTIRRDDARWPAEWFRPPVVGRRQAVARAVGRQIARPRETASRPERPRGHRRGHRRARLRSHCPLDRARHEAFRLAVRASTHRQWRDRLPRRHVRTEAHPGGERRIAGGHRRALGPERGPALEREPEDARPHRSLAAR